MCVCAARIVRFDSTINPVCVRVTACDVVRYFSWACFFPDCISARLLCLVTACVLCRWDVFSPQFDIYWGKGETRRGKFRGKRDPLLDKMPWPVQGFTFRDNTPSLFEMRATARGQHRRTTTGNSGGRREGVQGRRTPGRVRGL